MSGVTKTTARGIRYSTYSSNMTTGLSHGEERKGRLTLAPTQFRQGITQCLSLSVVY